MRVAVFDLDGTLIRSPEIKRRLFFEVGAAHGIAPQVVERVLADLRGDRYALWDEIVVQAGAAMSGSQLAETYTRLAAERLATCPEVPGATDALRELGARVPVYVCSATPQAPLLALIAQRGLGPLLRGVRGGPTPKPQLVREVLAAEGCHAAEALLVGDGVDDFECARELGCRFVGIRGGSGNLEGLAHPLVDDLRHLAALADRLFASRE